MVVEFLKQTLISPTHTLCWQ